MKRMKYHICLGSNIGERKKNLALAIKLLKKRGVVIVNKSSIYETSPVGETEQPWFLNQVLEVNADSEPRTFLRLVLDVEKRMGRTRTAPKGPRCIDIDILLAEDRVVRSEDLDIPHPELANRNFVLVPLKPDASTPCFRQEAGSYGTDTCVMIRAHQFNMAPLRKALAEPSIHTMGMKTDPCRRKAAQFARDSRPRSLLLRGGSR